MKKILFICLLATSQLFSQKVVIDPGHGWGSPLSSGGCSNPDGRLAIEMECSYETGTKLKNKIDAECSTITTLMTRNNNLCNSWISLSQRTTMANSWGADALLSIHTNGGGGTGTETYWCNNSPSSNTGDQTFSNTVQNDMVNYGSWNSRRSVADNSFLNFHLYILRFSNMSSVLSEIGFGDNANDFAKLSSDSWRDQFALAYYESLKSVLNVTCAPSGPVVGTCATPIQLDCGDTYTGSTSNGESTMNKYSCSNINQFGKEKIHEITLTQTSNITAAISGLTVDLDIHLLSSLCDSTSCIARDDFVIGVDSLPAGTYYIVVDGFGTAATAQSGSYTLKYDCSPVSKGSGTCQDPIQLICGERFRGTNSNGLSATNSYSCSSASPENGKEKIHTFTVTDSSNVSIVLSELGQDLDIHLATSCGNGTCIARDDNSITVNALPPGTYYAIVDGFGTTNPGESNYTIALNCTPISGGVGTCLKPIALGCDVRYIGTTSDGDANVSVYQCDLNKAEQGKEKFHSLVIDSLTSVNILLQNMTVDLDIHVLTNPCDPSTCFARADNSLFLDSLFPGTYYIVVDGFGNQTTAQDGPYDLVINCNPITGSATCKDPIEVFCGVPYNGTTVTGADGIDTYGCSPLNEFGKENVHKIVITDTSNVVAALSNLAVNLDVMLLTDSCDGNTCLGWGYNTLSIDSLLPGTYYFSVDGQGTDAQAQSGSYTLTITCTDIDTTTAGGGGNPSSLSENRNDPEWVEVFPNPTANNISLRSNRNEGKAVRYTILDMTGSLIKQGTFNNQAAVSLSAIAKGQYIIRLTDGYFDVTKKIIKL